MCARKILNDRLMAMGCWFTCFLMLWAIWGCGESSSESDSNLETPPPVSDTGWQIDTLLNLDSGGTVMPNVKAVKGSNGRIHIIYFSDAPAAGNNLIYTLNYLIWIPQSELLLQQNPKPQGPQEGIEGLDNSRPAALALDDQDTPIIVYQGGNIRPMGAEEQSDVMISLIEDIDWAEYTGAIGYVERNPFHDGLARPDLDVAVDSNGDIHLCFQFFYEGIDADNERYPDINYVLKHRLELNEPSREEDWAIYEETVHGNEFQGSTAIHNSVGYHCKMVLDSSGQPVIIYAEHTEITNTHTLWAAYRVAADQWQRQAIDQFDGSWRVNDISAAVSPVDGSLAVAYQLKDMANRPDEGDHLRFVQEVDGVWARPMVVDNRSSCGDYVSLTYDSNGTPAVAYFDDQSHAGHRNQNLKLAHFNGATWQSETVSDAGNVGYYNSIWFDDSGRVNICSYSRSEDAILIFSKLSDF